jgi:HEAT repeat protein
MRESDDRGAFDGEKCIAYLLDRQLDFWDRLAAAESLDDYQTDSARAALFEVLMDESSENDLRDECVVPWASLGELGYRIPSSSSGRRRVRVRFA